MEFVRSNANKALELWFEANSRGVHRVIRLDELLENVARSYLQPWCRESYDEYPPLDRAVRFVDTICKLFVERPNRAFLDFVFDCVHRVDALYDDLAMRLSAYQEVRRAAWDAFKKKHGRDPEEGTLDVTSTCPYYVDESVLYSMTTDVSFVRAEAEFFKAVTSEIREEFVRSMFIVPLGDKFEQFKQSVINEHL